VFTYNSVYIQQSLHTTAFTYNSVYIQQRLHTTAFTYNSIYIQQRLHTTAFTYNSVYIQQRLHTSISVLGLWEAEKFFGNSINAKSYVYGYFITSNWKYQIILIYPDIPCKLGYSRGVYKNHPPCLSLQLSVSPYFL